MAHGVLYESKCNEEEEDEKLDVLAGHNILHVDEGKRKDINCRPYKYMWIDCLDTQQNWIEAQIMEVDRDNILIHYKGYDANWREWLKFNSHRIAPIGTHTKPLVPRNKWTNYYRIGMQIDVLDTVNKWMRARIIDINIDTQQVYVTYLKWPEKFNEWIDAESYRLAPLHFYTKPKEPIHPQIPRIKPAREALFRENLNEEKRLYIIDMEPDGNCLFRSFSFHIYGSANYHQILRHYCMEYVKQQRQFFSEYVEEDFDQYVERMKYDGEWGGELEIRAMGELYARPVEIYVYHNEPMRTYRGPSPNSYPIRVSYHANSHYNAVVDQNDDNRHHYILNTEPGQYENNRLIMANPLRDEQILTQEQRQLRQALIESRKEYDARDLGVHLDQIVAQEVEEAKKQSLAELEEKELHNNDDIERAITASLQEESLREQDLNSDVALAKNLSLAEYNNVPENNLPEPVRKCIEMGYDQDAVQMAYMMLNRNGENNDTILQEMLAQLNFDSTNL